MRQKLEEELQEERDRHNADIAERDFAMNQTQITYQSELITALIHVCCLIKMM